CLLCSAAPPPPPYRPPPTVAAELPSPPAAAELPPPPPAELPPLPPAELPPLPPAELPPPPPPAAAAELPPLPPAVAAELPPQPAAAAAELPPPPRRLPPTPRQQHKQQEHCYLHQPHHRHQYWHQCPHHHFACCHHHPHGSHGLNQAAEEVFEVRYVRNSEERCRILKACHVDLTSGHTYVSSVLSIAFGAVFLESVTKDIAIMISTCDFCQRNSQKLSIATPELFPVPVHSPWHHVGIDFIGPISPKTTSGNSYILTLCDYFTKWVEAVARPTKEASGIASSLFKIFMKMGLPAVITTDQGSEFKNQLNDVKILNIRHHLITAYHPQVTETQLIVREKHLMEVNLCQEMELNVIHWRLMVTEVFLKNFFLGEMGLDPNESAIPKLMRQNSKKMTVYHVDQQLKLKATFLWLKMKPNTGYQG
ncbi:hypothetical protein EMCRGX_G021320, partial [Ephydatia muelleri]